MAKTLIIFTISTIFLFTVTTAFIASDPVTVTDSTNSDVSLPESDETTQTFVVKTIDQSPLFIFSRPHPIKRQFHATNSRIPLRFVKRRPCRKSLKHVMIPRSYGNDAIINSKTFSFNTETIGNDQVPQKWLEFKHSYGHHHDHEHKEKKREHKGGFVRQIRKFLKHTFD